MSDPFAGLAGLMFRWRWVVVAFWFVLLNGLAPVFAPNAAESLKGGGLMLDGTESKAADQILGAQFDLSSQNNLVAVFRSKSTTVDDASFRNEVTAAVERLKTVAGVSKVSSYYDTEQAALVSSDRHTSIVPILLKGDEIATTKLLPKLRDKLKGMSMEHYVLGDAAVAVDAQSAAENDLRRAELVTLPLIVILLLVVFRTVVAALVPLILGVFSIALTVSMLGILGPHTEISVFALNVSSLVGLGLAIDYSLIILTRYREELAIGHEPARALAITMTTAGRSIAYSALTVVVAMAAVSLVLAPIMIVRSISLAVLLVAILALLLAMTLLPALMAVLKHRLEWLRVIPKSKPPRPGEVGMWYRFSQFIMARPWVWLAACLVLLLGLASPIGAAAFGSPTPAAGTEAAAGITVMKQEFAPGRLSPIYIIVKSPNKDGVWTPTFLQGVRDLSQKITADARVSDVSSLSTVLSSLPDDRFTGLTHDTLGQAAPAAAAFVNVDANNDATKIIVVSKYLDSDPTTTALVQHLRDSVIPGVGKLKPDKVYVGGQTAVVYDFKSAMFGRFPWVAAAVGLVILVILMMFFQSIALPVKAVLMNLISIGATFGVLSLVFQHGFGASILDFTSSDYLTVISPGILYVILLALSTDYEVFMLSRVKEYFKRTGNNEEAVAAGLQHTAGIITAAGLILVITFGSFLVSKTVVLKEIGLGLGVGVLLDSTIIRIVMVPATMRLLGAANWWMPAWLKRIVPEISEKESQDLADYTEVVEAPAGTTIAQPPAAAAAGAAVPALNLGTAGRTMTMPTFPGGGQAPPTPAARLGSASLLVSGTWDGVPVIPLLKDQDRATRFGRVDSNEIHLPSLAVSRWHARIDHADGQYRLTDLDSVNGVYVNGVRIPPRPAATVLHPADHIVIGGYPKVAFTLKAE